MTYFRCPQCFNLSNLLLVLPATYLSWRHWFDVHDFTAFIVAFAIGAIVIFAATDDPRAAIWFGARAFLVSTLGSLQSKDNISLAQVRRRKLPLLLFTVVFDVSTLDCHKHAQQDGEYVWKLHSDDFVSKMGRQDSRCHLGGKKGRKKPTNNLCDRKDRMNKCAYSSHKL